MKATKEATAAAKQQLRRMGAELKFCPTDEDGWKPIGRALIESAASVEHMQRITTALLTDVRYDAKGEVICTCPTALELRAFAISVPAEAVIPDGCECCANPSYDPSITDRDNSRSVHWLPHISRKIRGYDCTDRCDCDRGKFLRAQDAARSPDRAAGKKQTEPERVDRRMLAAGEE